MSPYLVCGQCRHFTGEPYGLGGDIKITIWKRCAAKECGVRADTTGAEYCEHFLPPRIQRRRVKGWRMPKGAVYVGRPSRWGNRFFVTRRDDWFEGNVPLIVDSRDGTVIDYGSQEFVTTLAIEEYRRSLLAGELPVTIDDVRRELRGKALCCWCRVGDPCHADVLLEIANTTKR